MRFDVFLRLFIEKRPSEKKFLCVAVGVNWLMECRAEQEDIHLGKDAERDTM